MRRFSGAGDKGVDIGGFLGAPKFSDGWDNYQCKHYDHAMYPSDAWLEIGKLIYHTFCGEFDPPQNYYFVAPFGIGTGLTHLSLNGQSRFMALEQRQPMGQGVEVDLQDPNGCLRVLVAAWSSPQPRSFSANPF